MVWGSEQAMQHAVQCNALMQVNDDLRNRLGEADARVKKLEHDLGTCRQVVAGLQTTLDENRSQSHQLVRQRDLAEQKLSNANHQIQAQQEATNNMASEHDRVRFSLEGQIKELRSRLVLASDNGDALAKDLRGVLSELRERNAQNAGLQSQIRVSEASLSSQRNANDSILVELRGMNEQLTSERKKVLGLSRDLQVAQLNGQRVLELEEQVRTLLDQRRGLEQESLRMVSELTESNTKAFKAASEEMKDRLGVAEQGVTHWQHVAELLYREIGELTAAHVHCRGECDETKKERDALDLSNKRLREELQLCQAKLEIVWPSHRRDTQDMDIATLSYAFKTSPAEQRKIAMAADSSHMMLARTDTSPEEQVLELQEANKFLVAEVEVMRTTNGLLTERLHALLHSAENQKQEKLVLAARHDQLEDAGRKIVSQQSDRIRFLEQQVQSMKGVKISPNTSLQTIGTLENILEVFIGQLISAQVVPPGGVPDFSLYFCTVDFLVHETVTSPTLTGLNGFLDTTVSYCASMDSLLVYFLRTRGIVVQLHRVTGSDDTAKRAPSDGAAADNNGKGFELVAEGFASLWDLVSGERLRDQRPALRGHIPLYAPGSQLVASVEFSVTARAPFSQHFVSLCAAAAEQAERLLLDSRLAEKAMLNTSAASRGAGVPGAHVCGDQSLMSAGPSVSLAHIAPGGFRQLEDVIADPPSAISITVRHVSLNKDLPVVPRISCYATVSALQADAFIPAPAKAQFAFDYTAPGDPPQLDLLQIKGVADMLALLREPVAFFFFDETTAKTAQQHWAVAVWDLAAVLTSSGGGLQHARDEQAVLALTSYNGSPVGDVAVALKLLPKVVGQETGATSSSAVAPPPPPPAAIAQRQVVVALEDRRRTLDEELMTQQLQQATGSK